ncbi:SRPBCC family protein [Nonomuraea lactucae]|uniref:SRPBCC family protein n=1 Tax=Nonomuraea lactucae TaxID=2249762 RepID=UPI000DE43937|nr:SRPBCC domain-containing protein [Nonomuraea lactucae]
MADILHRIGVEQSSPEQVYDALTTLGGLSGWWAEKTSGKTDLGGVIEFRFGPGGIDMKVAELDPGRLVRWEVVDGPREWIGTSVRWDLRQDGDYTIVLFKHEGWREPVEFMHHCSTKWGTFLMSLKQLLETGEGAPEPRDVRISDWH